MSDDVTKCVGASIPHERGFQNCKARYGEDKAREQAALNLVKSEPDMTWRRANKEIHSWRGVADRAADPNHPFSTAHLEQDFQNTLHVREVAAGGSPDTCETAENEGVTVMDTPELRKVQAHLAKLFEEADLAKK